MSQTRGMEHILFLNLGYPLEPLCRALRAGGAVSTVTESVAEWVHLSSIRPWSLCVIAAEGVEDVLPLPDLPERTALLLLSEDLVPLTVTTAYCAVWKGGTSASAVLRIARYRNLVVAEAPGELAVGDLIINTSDHAIWWRGTELILTPRQFSIIRLLATQPGRIFSRVEIWEHCWGLTDYPESNAVDAHLRRIRGRLPRDLAHCLITVYGVGYRLLPNSQLPHDEPVLPDELSQTPSQFLPMVQPS
jgi:DNA-binding winged helix-turn-helix (wHTH) protein